MGSGDSSPPFTMNEEATTKAFCVSWPLQGVHNWSICPFNNPFIHPSIYLSIYQLVAVHWPWARHCARPTSIILALTSLNSKHIKQPFRVLKIQVTVQYRLSISKKGESLCANKSEKHSETIHWSSFLKCFLASLLCPRHY